MLVRHPGESVAKHPYAKAFQGKQRTLECQIQGKFRRVPQEPLYVGAEITKRMVLGMLRRTLCQSILAFVRKVMGHLHYSFGDADNNELPHIVVPLWTAVDRLVVTPEGETAPLLGVPVPESDGDRTTRRSKTSVPTVDKSSTYTFSFNTMYLNLPSWVLCKLPMMGDMSLRDFWGDSSLRLVVYDTPSLVTLETGEATEGRHLQRDNRYFAKVQMTHDPKGFDSNGDSPSDEESDDEIGQAEAFEEKISQSDDAEENDEFFDALADVPDKLRTGIVSRDSRDGQGGNEERSQAQLLSPTADGVVRVRPDTPEHSQTTDHSVNLTSKEGSTSDEFDRARPDLKSIVRSKTSLVSLGDCGCGAFIEVCALPLFLS